MAASDQNHRSPRRQRAEKSTKLAGGATVRMHQIVTTLLFWLLVAGLADVPLAARQAAASGVHEFTVTAKQFEFDPSVITVKKGEKVRLMITAIDHNHGFKLEAFDIDQVLKKGDPTLIEFTAAKAGTFEFKCSVYCGKGHRKMKGKLVVEE
jgi:cytochrome c oxidase subunit 2